ncbi:MAG TPA: NUDIX domain-containing protein [Chitinophagales bacterium]|nr:NUDIX domain-containing protein [Chitinophagales bacterium]
MPKQSAGILFYRLQNKTLEVLLVHPGGPYWSKKDLAAWSIPKGEIEGDEEPILAAQREVEEELGIAVAGNWLPLTPIKQKSGKVVHAWAVQHDLDATNIKSNQIDIEWPPKSGLRKSIPEVDKAAWFTIPIAKEKIIAAQTAFLTELEGLMK